MYWYTKPGCPAYYKAAVKRIINTYPPSYLVPLISDEIFNNLEKNNRRIRKYTLAESFDIIKYERDIKTLLSYKFKYIFHNSKTQNYYKLKNYIKKDLKKNNQQTSKKSH